MLEACLTTVNKRQAKKRLSKTKKKILPTCLALSFVVFHWIAVVIVLVSLVYSVISSPPVISPSRRLLVIHSRLPVHRSSVHVDHETQDHKQYDINTRHILKGRHRNGMHTLGKMDSMIFSASSAHRLRSPKCNEGKCQRQVNPNTQHKKQMSL